MNAIQTYIVLVVQIVIWYALVLVLNGGMILHHIVVITFRNYFLNKPVNCWNFFEIHSKLFEIIEYSILM